MSLSERFYRRVILAQWASLLGLVFGAFFMPTMIDRWQSRERAAHEAMQRGAPVVTMQGQVVGRGDAEVMVRIIGVKHRECRYLGLQAYSVSAAGVFADANIKRADLDERGDTKPPGTFDLGVWRIWPLQAGASRALVYVNHDCAGVHVRTVIADVAL